MKDAIFYFLLGFMSMGLIAMIIISRNPTPKPDFVCGGCGGMQWYSVMAEGEE